MKKSNIFWGSLLILGAIALIANELGGFAHINAFSIVLTLFLGGIIITSIIHRHFTGIIFPIAFLCIIYDEQLGITAITPWTILLAALLLNIGLSMIFHKHTYFHHHHHYHEEFQTINIEDANHIKVDTTFSGTAKYINTDDFEQADLSCSFGALSVYFDNAALHEGKGLVIFDVSFAGVELYIPKTWTVINKVDASFGDVTEKNHPQNQTSENTLTLAGDVSFAGVTIIYV